MSTPDGRTDIPLLLIQIFRRSSEHDPHAIVECKRIAEGDATLVREYVSEGIDRFCTGKYASNHSRGFMAGYVLAGGPDGAVEQINRYLTKCRRSAERLNPSTITAPLNAWMSKHPRAASGTTVELNHAMLLISHA
jgi:hypothetical protein